MARSPSTPPQIGGIAAHLWVGRRVRFRGNHINTPHLMRGTLKKILPPNKALVHPHGHRGTVTLPLSEIRPWWSQNPDLISKRP